MSVQNYDTQDVKVAFSLIPKLANKYCFCYYSVLLLLVTRFWSTDRFIRGREWIPRASGIRTPLLLLFASFTTEYVDTSDSR